MGEALDVGIVFGFDHDAGELLGAGISEDDAAVFSEGGVGFGKGSDDFGKRFERRLGFDLHVDDGLGIVLETGDEGIEAALEGDERSDFDGGEKAVAGGRVFEKNDVARLFAAENVAAFEHFFEDVTIADIGAGERDIFSGEDAFKAEIGHGRGDDAIAGQFILRFEITRDGEKNAVAVDDGAVCGNEEGAIGIAIEGDAKGGAFGGNALLQFFEMKRAAAGVDVAAVGCGADCDDVAAEGGEKLGAELEGGAIGAIEHDAKTIERRAGNNAAAKKIEILMMEGIIRTESGKSE